MLRKDVQLRISHGFDQYTDWLTLDGISARIQIPCRPIKGAADSTFRVFLFVWGLYAEYPCASKQVIVYLRGALGRGFMRWRPLIRLPETRAVNQT